MCLPRLDLNGALLFAKLVNYVNSTLHFNTSQIHLWSGSSIVLGWLSKPPSTWETYIANRSSQILSQVPNAIWQHVPTHDNPADLGTRCCRPQDLTNSSIWWYGPSWLTKPHTEWPKKRHSEFITNEVTQSLKTIIENNDVNTLDSLLI